MIEIVWRERKGERKGERREKERERGERERKRERERNREVSVGEIERHASRSTCGDLSLVEKVVGYIVRVLPRSQRRPELHKFLVPPHAPFFEPPLMVEGIRQIFRVRMWVGWVGTCTVTLCKKDVMLPSTCFSCIAAVIATEQ